MTLNEIPCGRIATVKDLSKLPRPLRKKLMVMGILPNTPITLVRRAPFGDPLQISVREGQWAIRSAIASQIVVEISA